VCVSDGVLRVGVKSLATDRIQNRCRGVAGSGFYYLFSWALSGSWAEMFAISSSLAGGHLYIVATVVRHRFSLFIFI